MRKIPVGVVLVTCAPLPALVAGIVAMRQLGVATHALLTNAGAAVLGIVIWTVGRRVQPPTRRAALAVLTVLPLVAILLPFAGEGVLGVYRWVPAAGLRLHASAIVAPLIISCVAATVSHRTAASLAIAVTGAVILAVQPDAAQTVSVAAACIVLFVLAGTKPSRSALLSAALLFAVSMVSFLRPDPLLPVAHVEEIFRVVASRGPGWTAMAIVALALLPAPFFAAWHEQRRPIALALGVYVVMTLFAPVWGTFPVPVMGYGASPILGYFIALAVALGDPSRLEELCEARSSSSST